MSESVIIGVDHGYAAMKTAHFSLTFPGISAIIIWLSRKKH